jgi:transcriptional regulator with XRE-family HTH domain
MLPFPETVLAWRLARGMTQADLARKSGVSRPNLSAIERGAREVTLKTLRALAMALDVRPGILADGCAPNLGEGALARDALERVAEAAAGGHRLSNAREATLAKGVRTAMSSRIGESPATLGRKRGRPVKVGGRAADRAYFLLRATESPEDVASLFHRTAEKVGR